MPEPSTTLGFWGWLAANSQDIRNLVLAGAALVALPLFAWRVMLVRRWAEGAQRQAAALEREIRIAERNEAAAQLANPEPAVRTAAIFTLERVARELPSEHGPIMDTLIAFVRDRVPVPLGPPVGGGRYGPPTPKQILVPVRADVQAALTVLGRRDRGLDPATLRIALPAVNLSGYDLTGAELTGADFRGSYFVNAILANAKLRSANLLSTHFEGADLYGLNGQRANFAGAACPGARFATADLEGADFQQADLSGADLTRAKVTRADLRHAVLDGARFDEAIGLPSARVATAEPGAVALELPLFAQQPQAPTASPPPAASPQAIPGSELAIPPREPPRPTLQ